MGKVLIGYATRSGAAHDVADAMAEAFRADGHEVRVASVADRPRVDGEGLVVLGSGINAGSWYPEAVAWLTQNAADLEGPRVAVFSTCLNAADPAKCDEAEAYNETPATRTGAVARRAFAGRYVPAKVGFFQRLLLKAMQQPARDHVDRNAARAWARELAPLIDG